MCVCVYKIITLYSLNIYIFIYQLYLNKTRREKKRYAERLSPIVNRVLSPIWENKRRFLNEISPKLALSLEGAARR